MREYNFDGIVGPTHNYAGLSPGNLASAEHAGRAGNPRAAALQGLAKMRFVAGLGVGQAVLPPAPRPDVRALRRLGFEGSDAEVLERACAGDGQLLRLCSSASSMWTANAATVVPSTDSTDGKLHLVVANLSSMFHRSLEAESTFATLRSVFSDGARFVVHAPLPAGEHFADEGAANQVRIATGEGVAHVFLWGRSAFEKASPTGGFPRRQTREASEAVARSARLRDGLGLFWQQGTRGIDAGAFHTDVLAAGHENVLLLHEFAFEHAEELLNELVRRLGPSFVPIVATNAELPVEAAVRSYPFNSQLVTLPDGAMTIVAPAEARKSDPARSFLERVIAEANPVSSVHFVDVNASMDNGGGPACLRLRVSLTDEERRAVAGRVFFDVALDGELVRWVEKHYRDRLGAEDLRDPSLLDETRRALDELTTILELGSLYDFQKP